MTDQVVYTRFGGCLPSRDRYQVLSVDSRPSEYEHEVIDKVLAVFNHFPNLLNQLSCLFCPDEELTYRPLLLHMVGFLRVVIVLLLICVRINCDLLSDSNTLRRFRLCCAYR